MESLIRPAAEWELAGIIADAAARRVPMEVIGAGSKRRIGHAVQASATLSTRGLRGITLYEPTELVMSAQAGTPLAEVEAELARRSQMLPFEPIDPGAAVGGLVGQMTIGGVFATNLSGSRRLTSGAARDHLLGARAVNGRGETFKSGGRVMKNVTGYDVARGLAGSWGTLAVMTEVTFKVVPAPESTATLVLFDLTDELAVEAMCAAMGTPFEVSAAVHLQRTLVGRLGHDGLRAAGQSITALRLENLAKSISYRAERLRELLRPYGEIQLLEGAPALAFWDELRKLSVVSGTAKPLWRLSTTPKVGPAIVAAISRYMPVAAYYDWSGGLIWLEVPESADAGATDIRRVIALHGGHATLIRAEPAVRAAVEVFQPLDPGVERLSRKLKETFDPGGVLNPGRMYATM